MKFLFPVVTAIIFISLACGDNDDRYELGIDDFYGVWANENCELVKHGTSEFPLFFVAASPRH